MTPRLLNRRPERASGMRSAAKRLVRNAAKDYGLGFRVPRAYRRAVAGGAPVDPRKALFVESSLPEPPDAFSQLMPWFEADPRFDVRFVSLGKHRLPAAAYLRNCEELAREAATARFVFLCDASDVVSSLPLRDGTDVVQLWHACGAFKRFGMSCADSRFGLSRADIGRHPFYGNLSLATVSSPEVAWAYVEAMDLEGREGVVQPLGVSRTDVFFDGAFRERALRRVHGKVPAAAGRRIVLYAPTYRGTMGDARAPELPDIAALRRALGGDSVLLVKHHPMVRERPALPAAAEGFAFDVSGELSVDELLAAADVLVTDYSSVVFEFSLLGRPMAFYAPDLDGYIDDRDFYYPYREMAPGPVFADSAALADHLAALDASFDPAEVDAFREKFMSACDGHATERILAFLGI